MIGQAGKGLKTYDIFDSAVDEIHHLSRKEPSFSALVPQGNYFPGFSGYLFYMQRFFKSFAFRKGFSRRFPY
ncbi:hypothetical protein SDC9_194687 [bioreactor metagenome]|uniref:Uncharacterized protein n=1 Tax=bioreactor metagenome TaxID=1076179 RepID=A0A645I6X8_9ZZZZ